ncbi:MAG: CHC2 zinc finger domain-containing protein [Chloroflexota bacterium]|nr:CHC2 zinc finger domain-containing protein [Chloroflexota bacterium]
MTPLCPYRYLSTRDLLDAKEVTAWDRADLANDPAGWDFPEESSAYLALVASEIDAELARRERLRRHLLAPAWAERGRDDLDAIRDAVDLPALVEKYAPVTLRQVGRQVRGRCLLHEGERTDDFVVNSERGLWHCFGCGKGGDCFSFVEAWLGLDFPGAVRFLADESGVALAARSRPATLRRSLPREGVVRVG